MLVDRLGQPHTPLTRKALESLRDDPQYHRLLDVFGLTDLASDPPTLSVLGEHHDAASQLGLWVAVADHIASAENDPDWTTTPLAAARFVGLSSTHFFHISFPSFSKNEFNAVGKLILFKLLYETVERLPDITLLYETKGGCRIVTPLSREQVHVAIGEALNQTVKDFVRGQDMSIFFKGGSQEADRYAEMLPFSKEELVEVIGDVKKGEILAGLRNKLKDAPSPPAMETTGLPKTVFASLAGIDLSHYGSGKQSLAPLKADMSTILRQAGVKSYAHSDVVDPILANYVFTLNKVKTIERPLQFDIRPFLAVDNYFDIAPILSNEPEQDVCIDCGTYHGVVQSSNVLVEMMQHSRETLFCERMTDARKHLYLCPICYIETLFNVLLCGTTGGMQTRVKGFAHMAIIGLDLPEDILRAEDPLFPEHVLRELRSQRITQRTLYAKDRDINIALVSLNDGYVGSSEKYREILFGCQAASIRAAYPLTTSFSVNMLPRVYDNAMVQLHHKDVPLPDDSFVDWFFYIFAHPGLGAGEERRHYVVEYATRPLLGIAYLFRRNAQRARYDEELERVVNELTRDDVLFQILDEIWEMAKLGGGLEKGRNVGSFLTTFKGRPEDTDRIANKLLRNEKLKEETRQGILDVWERVRGQIAALNQAQRRELMDRAQKTRYLMNSKKFYEVKRGV